MITPAEVLALRKYAQLGLAQMMEAKARQEEYTPLEPFHDLDDEAYAVSVGYRDVPGAYKLQVKVRGRELSGDVPRAIAMALASSSVVEDFGHRDVRLFPGELMTKPLLFVSVDALAGGYAASFLEWADEKFDLRILADRPLETLTSYRKDVFAVSKVECFPDGVPFYWVDTVLIPSEFSWLTRHAENAERFVSVDPAVGVTLDTRKRLEEMLK